MRKEIYSIYLFHILIWIFGFNLFGIPLYFILLDFEAYIDPAIAFHPAYAILLNIFSGTVTGLALGTIDIWIERKNAKKTSFRRMFLTKSISYTVAFFILIFFTGLGLRLVNTGGDWATSWESFKSIEGFHTMCAYLSFSILYSFLVGILSQVRRNYGKGTLIPLFTGQYYTPKEEERIFMFLDLRGSTTIAEQLGHIKFSQLIQDCFYDLNRIVNDYYASIYQYVGDEAILVWTLKEGAEKSNCLQLFFAFKAILEKRKEHYIIEYGQLPTFKAGLNAGMVTITEIGVVKKDLTYHGDVLNTAARIQGMCNQFQKDCLISKKVADLLGDSPMHSIQFLDDLLLKGKTKSVAVYSVEQP